MWSSTLPKSYKTWMALEWLWPWLLAPPACHLSRFHHRALYCSMPLKIPNQLCGRVWNRRKSKELGAMLPELYLHGLAKGDFELALRGLLGEGALTYPRVS